MSDNGPVPVSDQPPVEPNKAPEVPVEEPPSEPQPQPQEEQKVVITPVEPTEQPLPQNQEKITTPVIQQEQEKQPEPVIQTTEIVIQQEKEKQLEPVLQPTEPVIQQEKGKQPELIEVKAVVAPVEPIPVEPVAEQGPVGGQISPKKVSEGKEEEDDEEKVSETVNLISIKCIPAVSHVLKGVVNQLYILFEIRAKQKPQQTKKERAAFNLANVLDRSGSMSGDKLNYSKAAIKEVIKQIDYRDIIHFVTYDDKVQVVFKDGSREISSQLENAVDSVSTGGSTNLYAGLEVGFRVVKSTYDGTAGAADTTRKRSLSFKNLKDKVTSFFDKNSKKKSTTGEITKRIFLFSDGQTNVGIKDNETIFANVENMYKEGVSVTTFGIGDDYNEALMRGIADSSKGNYFFIDSPENIKLLVTKAFNNLLWNLASDALLKVRGAKETILKRIMGKPPEANTKGASLGDIREGKADEDEVVQVLCEFEVKPQDLNEADILTFEFSFLPANSKKRIVQTGSLKMPFTSDDKIVKENDEVMTSINVAQVNDMDKEVIRLLDEDKVEEAITQKEKTVGVLKEAARKDKSGLASKLLKHEEITLNNMQNRTESAKMMRKRNDYDNYMGEQKQMSLM